MNFMKRSVHLCRMRLMGSIFAAAMAAVSILSFIPTPAVAADLNAVTDVQQGGATIHDGDTVTRDDFSAVNHYWEFDFSWPQAVPNTRSLLAVFRGTFGNVEGGALQSGINYSASTQNWNAGTAQILKSIDIPPMPDLSTPSGTYTVMVAELATTSAAFDIQPALD